MLSPIDQLLSIVVFPGTMMHEFAHKKFCDWQGVTVRKASYFRFGETAGYIVHDDPDRISQVFWISIGPLIINTIFALVLSWFAFRVPLIPGNYLKIFLFWLAFSAGVGAFPSNQDMGNVLDKSKRQAGFFGYAFYILFYPFFALVYLANMLRRFGFDYFYALVLIFGAYYFFYH